MTWQPIETAPKDGTKILLGRFVVKCAEGMNGWMAVDYWHAKKRGKGYDGFGQFSDRFWPPTHWMPLPEPPQ